MPNIQELNQLIAAKKQDVARNKELLPTIASVINNRLFKSTNFALDVQGRSLVIEAFIDGQDSQKIEFTGTAIVDAYYDTMNFFKAKCNELAEEDINTLNSLIVQVQEAWESEKIVTDGN